MKCFVTIFNRYSWAIPLCHNLEMAGLEVIIIDNKSTYPPCVEWLKNCNYKIEYIGYNAAPWAFQTTDLTNKYKDRFYFLCDSDMGIDAVPLDFPDVLMRGLERAEPGIWKSGLSYEINDLPDNITTRQAIVHENTFWERKTDYGFYTAWIDIGCALHDRERKGEQWYAAIRSDRPYTAKHLDWYFTEDTIRDEDMYYLETTPEYYGWFRRWYDENILKKEPR